MTDPQCKEFWTHGEGADEEWYFKCKCGEKCSWWENPLYHPRGAMVECDYCSDWSHTACLLGSDSLQPEDVEEDNVFCYECEGKIRRILKNPALYVEDGGMTMAEIEELQALRGVVDTAGDALLSADAVVKGSGGGSCRRERKGPRRGR
jgi:hypothetical protein